MISISKFQSSEQATQYFQKDIDYYTKNQEVGEWAGALAEEFGLTGEITKDSYADFAMMMSNTENQRSGFDITFSAPKSVSALHAAANPTVKRLIEEAQKEANRETMEYAQRYITYRERTEEGRHHFTNNGLAIASFHHFTNREEEPQIHTHNFVLNQTRNSQGKLVAIDNRGVYQNQILLGQIYHQKLMQKMQEKLGLEYEIRDYKKDIFEVKGIDEAAIKAISTRRNETEIRAEELKNDPAFRAKYPNINDKEIFQIAALETRKAKKSNDYNDLEEIQNKNRETLAKHGITEDYVNTLIQEAQAQEPKPESIAIEDLIGEAAKITTEQESTFAYEKLLAASIKLNALHGFTHKLESIEEQIQSHQELVKLDEKTFTTKQILKIEKEIQEKIKEAQTGYEPLATKEAIDEHLSQYVHCTSKTLFNHIEKGEKAIKLDQAKMIREVLTSEASINIVQGDAGTGKTAAVKVAKQIIEEQNPDRFEFVGLAPTSQAALGLEEDSGIKSDTIHAFLKSKDEPQKERIYIIDEAGMIDSPLMHQLQQKIEVKGGGKILLIGDSKQFQSIGAGGIFTHLQKEIQISELTDKTRQKTEVLRQAVAAIEEKDTVKALKILKDTKAVHENLDPATIASKYNKDTFIIASTNALKDQINAQVRSNLQLQGESFITRQSERIQGFESRNIHSYKEGQVLFAQQAIKGIKAGQEAEVLKVDTQNHQITVEVKDPKEGKTHEAKIDVRKQGGNLQVYREEQRNLAVGDQVVFLKKDRKLGVANGTRGEVIKADKQGNLEIRTSKFKTVKFHISQYAYLDHAYALTDFKAQGATAKNVIVAADSRIATNNSFYTQITRAAESVELHTDNIEKLTENAARQQLKTSTLGYDIELEKSAMKAIPITDTMKNKVKELVNQLTQVVQAAKIKQQYAFKKLSEYITNQKNKEEKAEQTQVAETANQPKTKQGDKMENILERIETNQILTNKFEELKANSELTNEQREEQFDKFLDDQEVYFGREIPSRIYDSANPQEPYLKVDEIELNLAQDRYELMCEACNMIDDRKFKEEQLYAVFEQNPEFEEAYEAAQAAVDAYGYEEAKNMSLQEAQGEIQSQSQRA
jgi:conjugative relaxase-like TrwC/TraI family protein